MSLILLLFLCSTILITILKLSSRRYGKWKAFNLPQGNMGWPIVGETFSFLEAHPTHSMGHFMEQRISRFGKIFMSNVMGKPTVVSAHAELNRFILQNDLKLFEPGWSRSVGKILGRHSILLQVGQAHKQMRSINLNFLSSEKLKTLFIRDADRISAMLLSSWKDGDVISGTSEARKLTFHMMAKNILSMSPGTPQTERLRKDYEIFARGVVCLPLNLPGAPYRKALQSRSNILETFRVAMQERRIKKSAARGEDMEDDFLQWVIENSNYSSEQICDLVLGTFFGGHSTTSKAICLAIYFLEGSPRTVDQLREEHLSIVRHKRQNGELELNWDDYKKMKFTQCVVNETLRLGNVTKYIQRKASTDVQFKGYDIPQGCNVMAVLTAVHLDPLLFNDPEHFNPWRWQSESGVNKSNNFMAFGGGVRYCPGSELARLEIAIFLHHLVLNCNWELAEADGPIARPYLDFPKALPIKIRRFSLP